MQRRCDAALALDWLPAAPDWLRALAAAPPDEAPVWRFLSRDESVQVSAALRTPWAAGVEEELAAPALAVLRGCRERLAQAVPVARVADADADADGILLLWDGAQPGQLLAALSERGAPVLWLPAGCSVSSVDAALAPYRDAVPVESCADACTERVLVAVRSELRAAALPLQQRYLASPWLLGPLQTDAPSLVPTRWFRARRSQALLALEDHDDRVVLSLRYVPTGRPEIAAALGLGDGALAELPADLLGALLDVSLRGGELWSYGGLDAQLDRAAAVLSEKTEATALAASPLALAEAALALDPLWYAAYLVRGAARGSGSGVAPGILAAGLVDTRAGIALARRLGVRLQKPMAQARALRAALPAGLSAEALLTPDGDAVVGALQTLLALERTAELAEVAAALGDDLPVLSPLGSLAQALAAAVAGREAEAEAILEQAAAAAPGFAPVHRVLAVARAAREDLDGADAALTQALKLCAGPSDALARAGLALLAAVPDARLCTDAHGLRLWRAELRLAAGQHDAALAQIDAALAVLPEAADAHLARGVVLTQAGRLADAIVALDRAVALLSAGGAGAEDGEPDAQALARALICRAEAHASAGDAAAAQRDLVSAQAVDADVAAAARDDARLAPLWADPDPPT